MAPSTAPRPLLSRRSPLLFLLPFLPRVMPTVHQQLSLTSNFSRNSLFEGLPMNADLLVDKLTGYLDQSPVFYVRAEDDLRLIRVVATTDNGTFIVNVVADVDRGVVIIRSAPFLSVPPPRRAEVAKAISHINYFVVFGAFGLDLTDGELLFSLSLRLEDGDLAESVFADGLSTVVGSLQRHAPKLTAIAFSGEPAEITLGLNVPSPTETLLRALSQPDPFDPAGTDDPGQLTDEGPAA